MSSRDATTFDKEELRQKYDEVAPTYDRSQSLAERLLGVEQMRRELLQQARGEVLDVAAGTGRNFGYFPPGCPITAVDLSPRMLEFARRRAASLALEVDTRVMDAEHLEFPDDHFDTVVSSLSTCTFPDPIAALKEMARVCRPGGRILLLEHGRSSLSLVGWLQDRLAARHARAIGCHWNREPLDLARAAGLTITKSRRRFLGVFHAIEATP